MIKKPSLSKPIDNIRRIDPFRPHDPIIEKAADIIKKGGIVLFPTSTLYGMGADIFNQQAVDQLFRIKQRSHLKPISVLIENKDDITDLATDIPSSAKKLMDRFWPGSLTIIFKSSPSTPPSLTGGTGKIGIRIPKHPVALELIKKVGTPITGTSANLSGRPGCSNIRRLDTAVARQADLVLDAGVLTGGIGSTVIDATLPWPKIIRQGTITVKELLSVVPLS